MEIGNEISQKIRSAIKAKLVELGAYVDDELPDYIMVMVANKKSKAHMTDDLNLFLGNNTDRFTAWLHGLLQKLKSITVEQNKELEAEASLQDGVPAKRPQDLGKDTTEITPVAQPIPSRVAEQQKKLKEEEEEVERALEALEDDELTLQPDTDEFAEEEKMLTAPKQSKPQMKTVPVKPKIVTSQAKEAITKALTDSGKSRSGSRSAVKDGKDTSTSPKDISHKPSRTSPRTVTRSVADSLSSSRKRKAPGSVVGTIIKRDVDDAEEEYDPHKPQFGRVASTVKVGLRRPSVPASKQANKSLLMKAVSEAKSSIEKTTKKGVVAPMRRSEGRSSVHSRLGGSTSDARSRLGSQRSSTRRRSPNRATSPRSRMRSDEVDSRRSGSSRSKRHDSRDKSEPRPKRSRSQPEDTSSSGRVQDCRVFESKSDGASDVETDAEKSNVEAAPGSPQLDLLIQSGAEDSDFTDEEIQQEGENAEGTKRVVQERTSEGREKAPSPKFVVSLDGIDPDMVEEFEGRMDEDIDGDYEMEEQEEFVRDEELEEEQAMRARNIVRVRPMQVTMGEQQDVAEKKMKLADRCKFWPACSRHDCPYHHPTTPCKAFPNCHFGDKCNYVHPNCMFDASCTRSNCPYTHTNKKIPATSPPIIIQPIKMVPMGSSGIFPPRPPAPKKPAKTTCKFFPKCTNMNCLFYHPKPCRFGLSCRARTTGCPYAHPALPTKDQLKWTSTSKPAPSNENSGSLDSLVIAQADGGNQSDEEDESVNISL